MKQKISTAQQSTCRWGTKTSNPLKSHLNSLRHKAKITGSPPYRVAYPEVQHKYDQVCIDAKKTHWCLYLSQLTAKRLFMAASHTKSPALPRNLLTLVGTEGQITSDTSQQEELLFKITGGPTIPRKLSDITEKPHCYPTTQSVSTEDIFKIVAKLIAVKAQGSNGITKLTIKIT